MYLQDVDTLLRRGTWAPGDRRYGELCKRAEWEWSTYNFEQADVAAHFAAFDQCETEAKRLLGARREGRRSTRSSSCRRTTSSSRRRTAFNVLDARGAIGVTERQRFIGRVRGIAKGVAEAYLAQREAMGFPLLAARAAAE